MIENKCDTILQELFYFKGVIPSGTHPHPLHSLARGTQTLVSPIGYPHILVHQSTSTMTRREPTINIYSL